MKFIYTIEVSCLCNLKCSYCPHSNSKRKKGFMSLKTFLRSLELLKQLGQDYICLHNFGEPLLHPDIVDYVRLAKNVVNTVVFSTNGILLTREKVVALKEAGLTELYISEHSPEHAKQAIKNCEGLGLLKEVRNNFFHDWAGTAKKHKSYCLKKEITENKKACHFITDQWAVILWDGRVTSCCIDMEGKGIIGNIFDENVLKLKPRYSSLCQSCHMLIEIQ
ncbi:MAG: radical SAM protein [Nanoarchaeota archaeon]